MEREQQEVAQYAGQLQLKAVQIQEEYDQLQLQRASLEEKFEKQQLDQTSQMNEEYQNKLSALDALERAHKAKEKDLNEKKGRTEKHHESLLQQEASLAKRQQDYLEAEHQLLEQKNQFAEQKELFRQEQQQAQRRDQAVANQLVVWEEQKATVLSETFQTGDGTLIKKKRKIIVDKQQQQQATAETVGNNNGFDIVGLTAKGDTVIDAAIDSPTIWKAEATSPNLADVVVFEEAEENKDSSSHTRASDDT